MPLFSDSPGHRAAVPEYALRFRLLQTACDRQRATWTDVQVFRARTPAGVSLENTIGPIAAKLVTDWK